MALVTSAISCFRLFSASSIFVACAFISMSPFATHPLSGKGSPAVFRAKSEQSLKILRQEQFSQRIIRAARSSGPLSLLHARPGGSDSPNCLGIRLHGEARVMERFLVVQSRNEVGWIVSESPRLVCPSFADVLVGSEPPQGLEALRADPGSS